MYLPLIIKYLYYVVLPEINRLLSSIKPMLPFRPQLFGFLKIYNSIYINQILPFLSLLTVLIPIILEGVSLDFSNIGSQSIESVNTSLHDVNTESTTSENELVSKKKQNLKATVLFTLVVIVNIAIK